MLNYQVLIINESEAKNSSRSKDGHKAHLLTTIHSIEAKHAHEA